MRVLRTAGILRTLVRIAGLVVFFGFVALLLISFIGSCYLSARNPPDIKDAPWLTQTSSRIYYGKEYQVVDNAPAFIGYWTLDNDRYTFHAGTIRFAPREYGQVVIIRRTK